MPSIPNKKRLFEPPPSFWDNLSKHVLSTSTLREFDRRTTPLVHMVSSNPYFPPDDSLPLIKRFCRRGGPSLAAIVGYPGTPATPINTNHLEESEDTRPDIFSKMAYTAAWEQHMIDNCIYPPRYHLTQKPANLSDIQTRLKRRRPSLDLARFSDDDFSEFEKHNEEAKSKSSALTLVFSTFIGKLDIPHVQNSSFQNLRHLTDGSIPMPRPEFYDGAHPSKIEWELQENLAKLIMPSTNPSVPILPTFLMAVAAPKTSPKYLMRAAWYYGAFAARAVHQLRCRIPSQALNDKKAYIITADYATDSAILNLYATHTDLTDDPAVPFQYHTVLCGRWFLDDAEAYRTAISALRNAREWTRDHRDDLIRLANGVAMRSCVTIPETFC